MGNIVLDTEHTNINYSADVLKEDSPDIEVEIHLNTAYFRVGFPNVPSEISKINVYIQELGSTSEGEPDPENIIDNFSVEFSAAKIAYAENSEALPEHHFKMELNNSWYSFKFTYTYEPATSGDNLETWYSNSKEIKLNNTIPLLWSGSISGNIIGRVKTVLEKYKRLQIWYEMASIPNAKKYDVLKISGGLTQIKEIRSSQEQFITEPINQNVEDLVLSLIQESDFQKTFYGYFNNWIPESGEIQFEFNWNHEKYHIVITGNLLSFATTYFDAEAL